LDPEIQKTDHNSLVELEGEGEGESEGEREIQPLPTPELSPVLTPGGDKDQAFEDVNLPTCESVNVPTPDHAKDATGQPSSVPAHNRTAHKRRGVHTIPSDPVSTYRSLAHLTPNPTQRQLLSSSVSDLPLWQSTVEHWLSHGWNPRNLAGMLELYARGGPSSCHYCHRQLSPASDASSPLQHTLDAIASLRRKQG
jgi:hypothetical protein